MEHKNRAKDVADWIVVTFAILQGMEKAAEIFHFKRETLGSVVGWLMNPNIGWLAFPLAVIWILWRIRALDRSMSKFDAAFQVWLQQQQTKIYDQFNSQFQELAKETTGRLETGTRVINDLYMRLEPKIAKLEAGEKP